MPFIKTMKGSKSFTFRIARFFLRQNPIVNICIYGYTFTLALIGLTKGEFLSTNLQAFVNDIAICAVFYLFKRKTFRLSLLSLGLGFLVDALIFAISETIF